MKKNRGILYATAALAVLCVVYFGVDKYSDHSTEKESQEEEAGKVYMTDLSDVTAISYDKDGQELSFTKNQDTWNYDQDDLFPVKQEKLEALASTVSKIEAVRKLEDGDSLSAYGLDNPIRKISITPEDGEQKVILLGNATEDGDYYALIEGEDTPYLISSSLYSETDSGLDDFMALEEFPKIAGEDITSIKVTKDGNSQYYVKKKLDDGTIEWYKDSADSEDNKLSDNSGLNTLADSLVSLTVKSCKNYKTQESELSEYGLDNPSAAITYTYDKDGTEENFTISIGSLNEDSSSYYTRTENSTNVNEVEKASIDKCLTVNEGV